MRVAVCDDNNNFLTELENRLQQYPFVKQVEQYTRVEVFFEELKSGEHFDLLLMDLDWGEEKTGLEYAEQLYRTAPHIPVIYVTGYNDRFAQHVLLKETNLAGYLTKPIDDVLLEKYLQKVIDRRESEYKLSFQQQGRVVSLDTNRIIYLESRNHTSIVHTDTETYSIYEKISSLFTRLPNTFVQCHKSYVVNMRWIQRLEAGKILLKNGEVVSVSRTYTVKTREKVLRFMGL